MANNNSFTMQRGFTLVELSIVLIIIGFIIAGVAAGQSLIASSRLNGIITEEQGYQSAINNFRTRYQYLPGDFPKAADIWSTTTSGNGDGLIQWSAESYTFWQQLKLAGNTDGQLNQNNEKISRYGNSAMWRVESFTNPLFTDPANTFNVLQLMYPDYSAQEYFISARDAYSIDSKVDDGQPTAGRVKTVTLTPTGCLFEEDGVTFADNTYNSDKAKYNLTTSDVLCHRMLFYLK